MRWSNSNKCSSLLSLVLLGTVASTAYADPIAPSYTVTDLGAVSPSFTNPQFSTDANGDGIVIAPGGTTAYPFPQTFAGTSTPTPTNFPLLDPVPSSPGAFSTYSSVQGVTLYPNGFALATDSVGVSTQPQSSSWNRMDAYYVTRNSDGSWSQPVAVGSSATQYGAMAEQTNAEGGIGATLSKSGNILISTSNIANVGNASSEFGASVYNINTQTSTDLTTLPYLANNNYSYIRALAIDDDGRILLEALHQAGSTASDDLLLLTPAGVSSDPLTVPEPSTLAVMTLALAAFAIRSVRDRRRQA